MNKKILVALSLIILGVMVNAHTLEGNFEGLTFQGETVESVFYLCNSSSSGENFNISDNSIWMEIRPLSVYINADSCEEIYAFTTPFPYAESGKHEIEVTAKGETDSVSRTFYLTVVEGHKISINSNQNSINSTQCNQETFEIELKNTGIFDERALISVQGINPNWISLSSEEILLPKNQTRNFELDVLIPCNEETKNYEFTLFVELKNTGIIKEKTLAVNVKEGQGIGIESKEFNACNDLKTEEKLMIENSGILSDNIKVELEGLNWITLKENSFSLNPGQTKELELEFNGKDLEKGNYNFTLKIYSEKFNNFYSKDFSVKLEDCFNLEVTKGQFQDSACIESTPEISFIIKNTGTRKANVKAGIEGINAVLEKNSIGLNPNESTEIKAKLNLSEEQEGKINFIFLADSENYSASLENSIEIQNCYETEAIVPSIEVCNEVPLTGKFIVIKNTGTKKQSFEVSSDVDWIKLEETNFELEGNQEKTIGLIITPGKDSREENYSIKTKTENNQYQLKASITYPNQQTCFGISMTNLQSTVDVNAGEGSITTIKITNNGRTIQHLEFSVDNYYWVYFNPKEFDLMENETKEVYVYFNPPFDFKEETVKVKIKGTTNFGFKTEQEVQVNISGGSVVLTINPEDIKVNSTNLNTEDTNQNTVEIKIEIANNTETNMKILDIKSNYPNSKYFIEDPIIKKGTASEARLSFTASTELNLSGLEVPIEIITDKGTYYKVVTLPEKESMQEEKENEAGEGTGFVLFGGDEYILVILIVIVVILIIMAAIRTGKEEKQEEIVDYSEEKNFQDEIKEIVTKPAKTEKPIKSKTTKKKSKKKKK
ncbi:MAG: hypothetical protein ABH850_00205 [Candidatus Micrarchaeota archaeon]|nr:hypothetical protein [Candidatus Micrarchaeota archaeon]